MRYVMLTAQSFNGSKKKRRKKNSTQLTCIKIKDKNKEKYDIFK